MNHSLRVTVLSSKLLAGWKIYEHASSEWVATYLSIRSRHSPLWFHFASNKIQTALQTKNCSSPPRLLLPWALWLQRLRGFWCYFNLSYASNTLDLTDLSCNFLFQSTLPERPGPYFRHLLLKVPTINWFGSISAEQINAQYRPNWDSLSTFTILNCWLSANDSISELVTHVSMWGGNWNLCHYELFLSQRLQYARA